MNITKVRKTFTKCNSQLREARYNYVKVRRFDIMLSEGYHTINRVALEMIALELYAKPAWAPRSDNSLRDFRFSICRMMWKIDIDIFGKKNVGDWWLWLNRSGFNHDFCKIEKKRKTA